MFGFERKITVKPSIIEHINRLDKRNIFLTDYVNALDHQISSLKGEVSDLNFKVGLLLGRLDSIEPWLEQFKDEKPVFPIIGQDELYTTTDAILDVLKQEKEELHLKVIFERVKKYELVNPDVKFDSVKATIYGLERKGRLSYGKETSCFKRKD